MHPMGLCAILTSGALILSGVLLLILRVWLFDCIVATFIKLGPDTQLVDGWIKPPLDVYTKFYVFNWTNPEEILDKDVKPNFEELGPYTFRTDTEKVNISWNDNNTVTFRLHQVYYFNQELSNGSLDDIVTTLNTVTLSGAHKMRFEKYYKRRGFSISLGILAPELHVTKRVGEFLFDGYSDPYVNIAQTFPFLSDGPEWADKGGFLYGRNNSHTIDGVFNIATGVNENMGEIQQWNYLDNIPQYKNSCAALGGSIGDYYHQRQQKAPIKMFIANLCRNLRLDFEKDVTVENLAGYRYSAQDSFLDNGTKLPEKKCECTGECQPSGLINLTDCAYGAPTFLSLPHFYGADPMYLDLVEGLKPEKSKHELFVTVEPRLGFCLDLGLRIQVNFLLHPIESIRLFSDVPTIYFPVLWSEQRVTIPSEFAWPLRILLNLPTIILPVIAALQILIAVILLLFKFLHIPNGAFAKKKVPEKEKSEHIPLNEKEKSRVKH